jgi:hypothetical protein
MLKYALVFVLLIRLLLAEGFAQDSIVLYNGKSIMGKVHNDKNQTYITYTFQKKNKIITKSLYKENVFAVYYHDSLSDVMYVPRPDEEINFTEDQMQSYISGENFARYRYHPRWATVCGVASGLAGIYFSFYGMLIPPVYIAVASSTPVKPLKKKYFPPEKVNDEFFVEGFKQEAKRKKLVNSVIGGVSGFIVLGTTLGILTTLDYKNW